MWARYEEAHGRMGCHERDMLTVLSIALPAVLAHSEIIRIPAMIMSITGGLLIYGTIISFGMFFQEEQEF
jgi:hypothetical protein